MTEEAGRPTYKAEPEKTGSTQQQPHYQRTWACWCWRYGLPLMLMSAGWWLWRLGVAVPGAPVVLPGIGPQAVEVDKAGDLYVAYDVWIWKLNRWGKVEQVAGCGEYGYSGDGGPAGKAKLSWPSDLAFDAQGNLYMVESGNACVRKVEKSGTITTVAGCGEHGYSGDSGQATKARLARPLGMTFDTEGNLYIADAHNYRVRKVDREGIITTVAGNGQEGDSGDGGQAVKARLSIFFGIAVDVEGNLFIADSDNRSVRKVDKSGIITTMVGNGEWGYGGDGGQATEARLRHPEKVILDTADNLYIADSSGHCVRRVNKTGIITTVAGNGKKGDGGDGGKAVKARLNFSNDIAVDAEGNLYISDQDNHRVRKVNRAGIITTVVADRSRFRR